MNTFPTISAFLKIIRNPQTGKASVIFVDPTAEINSTTSSSKAAKPPSKATTIKRREERPLISKVSNDTIFREITVKKARRPRGDAGEIPDACPDCEKPKDSIKTWRYDGEAETYYCNTCFVRRSRRARMYLEEESGRMCVRCDRTRSNDWYRDKETLGDLCAACYMSSYQAKTRTDRTCNECNANVTRQWYKDKTADGCYICTSCYKRRLKK